MAFAFLASLRSWRETIKCCHYRERQWQRNLNTAFRIHNKHGPLSMDWRNSLRQSLKDAKTDKATELGSLVGLRSKTTLHECRPEPTCRAIPGLRCSERFAAIGTIVAQQRQSMVVNRVDICFPEVRKHRHQQSTRCVPPRQASGCASCIVSTTRSSYLPFWRICKCGKRRHQ